MVTAFVAFVVLLGSLGGVYLGWWLRGRIEVQTVPVPKPYGVPGDSHQQILPDPVALQNPYADPSVRQRMVQDAVAHNQQQGLPLDLAAIHREVDDFLRSVT